jgi:hypothetical protein
MWLKLKILKIITFKKNKMKNLLACILLLTTTVSFGQTWEIENLVDDFGDETGYRMIFVEKRLDKNKFLVYYEDSKALAIGGSYFCDDYPEVTFTVKLPSGEKKTLKITGYKSKSNRSIYFRKSGALEELMELFKIGTKVSITVSESHCDDEYFLFSLSGFTRAYNKLR